MTVDDVARTVAFSSAREWDAGRSAGSLVVAWQHPTSRLISAVGLLQHGDESGYTFRYLQRAAAVPDFQPFLSFPELGRAYRSDTLFPLFSQRIMSPRRPDFSQFLRQLDLDENATPWEQLARSEGRSSGDTVQVFPVPVVAPDGSASCRFLVHGVRHVGEGRLPELAMGAPLTLRPDPGNPVNPSAQLICSDEGEPLGYVPDLLLEHVDALSRSGRPMKLTVEHVNGVEAPPHLRLLVRLDGHGPAGYQPMSGPAWAVATT
ncbi:hypothetical protein PSU4_51380 [Pseudonocardia sulfidoxydans NBRC 16205]|uniref:HIRAN domain-containing protein n=1 Tax=Pseudonocardia sulfidoxydans NBRC 16205 TaxID=1223511 RepID=A0A511DR12_9PSEU|nr:hypothetical protein [Pseudonocardia sulfidoxydans]GEL26184.1 hypothetical protein PSU4_51380 [Pseudonocardia sulfidoxydans NBRC 16205]